MGPVAMNFHNWSQPSQTLLYQLSLCNILNPMSSFQYQVHLLIWMWFMVSPNNYNSNIKDYWSQTTMTNKIMKKFEILWELPKGDRKTKWENDFWKNGTDRFSWCKVATKLQFVNIYICICICNKVKHNKMKVCMLSHLSCVWLCAMVWL